MGQCFVKISFRFGNARLYFTDHDIYIVHSNIKVLLHFRTPPFFIDDSGAEFHAD